MATIAAGSRTEVVSIPWVKPRLNMPSKGQVKMPDRPYIPATKALLILAPATLSTSLKAKRISRAPKKK